MLTPENQAETVKKLVLRCQKECMWGVLHIRFKEGIVKDAVREESIPDKVLEHYVEDIVVEHGDQAGS